MGMSTTRPDAAEAVPDGPTIVGIGASAGGLEALTLLFEAMPADVDAAFVVVSHLDPDHPSRLAALIGAATDLPVAEAVDGARLEPGHVLVIPPNEDLEVEGDTVRLLAREGPKGPRAVIDRFLLSLADAAGARSMGVVLSGTGSDGAHGLKAIKEAGGITFAQDPASATYRPMPDAAAATGAVDFVLDPHDMAERIALMAARPRHKDEGGDEDVIQAIQALVERSQGIDFSAYKPTTFGRRLARRMALRDVHDEQAYLELLRREPKEVDALVADALIGVTSFFREPESFEALRDRVFPAFRERRPDEPVRIWVVGCSSGEEVYSIAMTLLDALGDDLPPGGAMVFGSDIHGPNIDRARAAVYPAAALQKVPRPYRERYFVEEDGEYRVAKRVRDLCVFAVHNVLRDPPLSNMDLVSCRNLLIYLGPEAQQRAVMSFHYALRPQGHLLLGKSESTGAMSEYFAVDADEPRLARKKDKPLPLAYTLFGQRAIHPTTPKPAVRATPPKDPLRRAKDVLHERYVPPGVIIDAEGEVLEFLGSTGAYLEPVPGRASLNLFRMARDDLGMELRALVLEARRSDAPQVARRARWSRGDETTLVDIEAIPVDASRGITAVTFRGVPQAKQEPRAPGDEEVIRSLRTELERARAQLHSNFAEYETGVQELRSSAEESLSVNEELQSTNEELQTTAEELQSANEELTTLNEELQHRARQITSMNSDLVNLLRTVQLPIVFLGPGMEIRRFTPSAGKELHLLPADVGRPIGDLHQRLAVPDLAARVKEVMRDVRGHQSEVLAEDGRWRRLRIEPYVTTENRVDGAVLVLIDIDELKRAMAELERSNHDLDKFAHFISHELREPLRNMKHYIRFVDQKAEAGDLAAMRSDLVELDNNLGRLTDLVNGILRLAEVDAATRKGTPLRVGDVVAAAASQVRARGIELEVDGGDVAVWGDEGLLVDLFVNLLSNAAEHGDERPRVSITTEVGADGVEIRVRDNGPGFPDEGDPFEVFHRGAGHGTGLGIGLAVARRIVEGHGGHIWVPPQVNGGEIRMVLPQERPGPAHGGDPPTPGSKG